MTGGIYTVLGGGWRVWGVLRAVFVVILPKPRAANGCGSAAFLTSQPETCAEGALPRKSDSAPSGCFPAFCGVSPEKVSDPEHPPPQPPPGKGSPGSMNFGPGPMWYYRGGLAPSSTMSMCTRECKRLAIAAAASLAPTMVYLLKIITGLSSEQEVLTRRG